MSAAQPQPDRQQSAAEKIPARATLFRLRVYDETANELFGRARQKLAPILKLRDGGKIKKIQAAQSPDELLDLAPQAVGLAADAWQAHLRTFGPAGVAAIAAVLSQIGGVEDETLRQRIYSLLIAELRWQGEAGVQVLVDAWERLDNFARGLACVVLGLARRQDAVDMVWDFYRQALSSGDTGFIGALWALLDFVDARLPDELLGFLNRGQHFYELFGFLARAGDAPALGPLAALMVERGRSGGFEPLMAASSIAQRTGRAATVESLHRYASGQEDLSALADVADLLLQTSEATVRQVFSLYYHGFRREDIQPAIDEI